MQIKYQVEPNKERSHQSSVFRFAGGDSQKSVAVVGEAESTLSYCGGREIVEFD
ncbi:hypothetical protein [Nostoc sp. DedQUE09]|uniref:hypothetical protein n=1 Tax=Nostoc sp. DedQUE09 TaxID=3075394 RepID=UPI002AD33D50|nr:hypothetical protein [Nostoc sp. DedQUE09]MDZ7955684.1 hypothetical protein [Nostoc sp. DedQUE09]